MNTASFSWRPSSRFTCVLMPTTETMLMNNSIVVLESLSLLAYSSNLEKGNSMGKEMFVHQHLGREATTMLKLLPNVPSGMPSSPALKLKETFTFSSIP